MPEHEPVDPPLKSGDLLTHYTGGQYRVLDIGALNAGGYERSGAGVISPVVRYVQLYDGDYPKGTVWTRSVQEIQYGTADVDGQTVPIFQISGERRSLVDRVVRPLAAAACVGVLGLAVYEIAEDTSQLITGRPVASPWAVFIAGAVLTLGAKGYRWLQNYKSPHEGGKS